MIYKGSKDGFKASDFHSKCDDKSNTLVIVKSSNGNIFGGNTEQSWLNTDPISVRIDKNDPKAFIFSLINKEHVHQIMVYVAKMLLIQYLEELKGKVFL